jgi:hypothetical protein
MGIFDKFFKRKKSQKKGKLDITSEIARIIHYDFENPDDVKLLSLQTALLIENLKQYEGSILGFSDLTCCDSLLFAAFFCRALNICDGYRDRATAMKLSNSYLNDIKLIATKKYGISDSVFDKMLNNRMPFYDSFYMDDCPADKKISAMVEEFEYIIMTDVIEGEYTPFSKTTALPVLGFEEVIRCHSEATTLFQQIMETADNFTINS